jgi:ubiquinone/menaquinone biosynthesis C-methylase UbiE
MNDQDRANHSIWSKTTSNDWLAKGQWFTDAGERQAYFGLMDSVRNERILDLGVGPGRTIPMLRALTNEYVGVDYLQEMVELARAKYPEVDVRVGDARDLSVFRDDSFSLVNFSYMGIDAVDHEGRGRILREAWRVLKPGGRFWFSTLNKEGPATRDRPWRLVMPSSDAGFLDRAVHVLRAVKSVPRDLANYLRLKDLSKDGDGWSVAPFSAHGFGLIVHYTTLPHQIDQLAAAGFEADPIVYSNASGRALTPPFSTESEHSFNIVARKPASTP